VDAEDEIEEDEHEERRIFSLKRIFLSKGLDSSFLGKKSASSVL
jgi:hypothetical protein